MKEHWSILVLKLCVSNIKQCCPPEWGIHKIFAWKIERGASESFFWVSISASLSLSQHRSHLFVRNCRFMFRFFFLPFLGSLLFLLFLLSNSSSSSPSFLESPFLASTSNFSTIMPEFEKISDWKKKSVRKTLGERKKTGGKEGIIEKNN